MSEESDLISTVTEGLGPARKLMPPGFALRDVRLKQGLTLSEVSERTGIPVSTLSKIENGKSEPPLDRLLKISVSLGVNMADLFHASTVARPANNRTRRSITRLGEADAVSSAYGTFSHHAQDLLDKRIMPFVAEIRTRSLADFGQLHKHDGEEYVYVLEGALALYTDTYTPVHLKAGEAMYFDSNMGHAYIADGLEPCKILIICTPIETPYLLSESAGAASRPGVGLSEPKTDKMPDT